MLLPGSIEAAFLAAAHDAPRSPSVDIVAAVLEREWWKALAGWPRMIGLSCGIDLQQSPSGCFRTCLLGPYAAAKGKTDRDTAFVVQHPFGTFEGAFCLVDALPRRGEFQAQKFGRNPASLGFVGVHHEVLTHWRGGSFRYVGVALTHGLDQFRNSLLGLVGRRIGDVDMVKRPVGQHCQPSLTKQVARARPVIDESIVM
ncbi:hypothetical protein [Mesorhizobium sp. NFR06]|uniref:hypothetical protein n=1 Tax=Mesorhizobium sp. NFR06 TaxID=1566290 RepID=UPI00165EE834|nr:hypothetical protein [Mesorhizobium sp. NFR06]